MFSILVCLSILPFAGALAVAPLRKRQADSVGMVVSGLVLAVTLYVINYAGGKTFNFSLGQLPWLESGTSLFGFFIDGLSSLLLIAVTVVGFLVVMYSAGYISEFNQEHPTQDGKGRYYFFLLLFIGAMVGLALAPNFLQLFIFWELTTLCSWALISHQGDRDALRAGFKALIITHGAGLFFVAALLIMFTATGSFAFTAMNALDPQWRALVIVCLLIAAWGKAAQFPFYTWLPTAMAAPTPASAYLHAAAMVKAGIYLAARVLLAAGTVPADIALAMSAIVMVTMYIGLIFYFFQDDLKRLLAFSTITHLSYMLLGLSLGAMGSVTGMRGGLLHLINHSFAKSLLFLSVGAISCATGTRSISALRGLSRKMPVTTIAFLVGALAISGVPPFNMFWSKYMIITGAIQLRTSWGWALGVLALAESVACFCLVSAGHAARLLRHCFIAGR